MTKRPVFVCVYAWGRGQLRDRLRVKGQLLEASILYICVSLHIYFPLMGLYPDQPERGAKWGHQCYLCLWMLSLSWSVWLAMCICMHVMHVLYTCVRARACVDSVLSLAAGWSHGAMTTLPLSGCRIQQLLTAALLGLGQMALILPLMELVPFHGLLRHCAVLWCVEIWLSVWTLKVTQNSPGTLCVLHSSSFSMSSYSDCFWLSADYSSKNTLMARTLLIIYD